MRAVFRLDARVGSRWCLKIEPAGRPGGLADEAVRLRWLATTGPLGAHVRDRAGHRVMATRMEVSEWVAPFDA